MPSSPDREALAAPMQSRLPAHAEAVKGAATPPTQPPLPEQTSAKGQPCGRQLGGRLPIADAGARRTALKRLNGAATPPGRSRNVNPGQQADAID